MSDMNENKLDGEQIERTDMGETRAEDVVREDAAQGEPSAADDRAHADADAPQPDADADKPARGKGKKDAHKKQRPVNPDRQVRRKRVLQYGGYSLVTIIVALAVLIGANFGIQKAEERFGWKIDLTPNKKFSLSDEAKAYLKTVDKKVEIYTTYTNNTASNDIENMAKETLERLVSINDNFAVGNIDIDRQPLLASKFKGESGTLARSSIVVSNPANERFRVLSMYDLVDLTTDQQTGQQYIQNYKIDQAICNALVYVTSDKLNNLYFVEGHGEQSQYNFSNSQSMWQGMNYEASTIKLTEATLATGDVVVIDAPTTDCSEAEREKLKTFITEGGRIVYITDADKPALPHFESVLEYYGVGITHNLVVEEDSNYNMQQQDLVISRVSSGTHDVTKGFPNNSGVMFYRATSFTLPEMPKNSVIVTPLVQSSTTSKQYNLTTGTADESLTGSAVMALSIEVKNPQGNTALDGKIVVLGADCFDSSFIQMWPPNEYMLSGSLSWMRSADESMYIPVKKPASSQLVFTSTTQILMLAALVIIVIPLLAIAAGIVVWLRRRHL